MIAKEKQKYWAQHGLRHITPTESIEFPEGWDVIQVIKDIFKKHYLTSKSVVDFGCGIGRLTPAFDSKNYTGLDCNPSALEVAGEKHTKYKFVPTDQLRACDVLFAYTVFNHHDDEEMAGYANDIKRLGIKYIVMAEILGSEWRSDNNFLACNRDLEDYKKIFSDFELVDQEDRVYEYYAGKQKNNKMTFLVFRRKSTNVFNAR